MSLGRSSRLLRQCRMHCRPEPIPRLGIYPPSTNPIRHPGSACWEVQYFHTTSTKNAARSPIARQTLSQRRRPIFTREFIFSGIVGGHLSEALQRLETTVDRHYKDWKETYGFEGSYESGKLSLEVYKRVAKILLQTAYSEPPSAHAIRSISTDVEKVWNISTCLFDPANEALYHWLTSACALAGATTPTLLVAGMYVRQQPADQYPLRTQFLDQVETMALHDHEPRAMLLHSDVLFRRGEYKDAMALMDRVMTTIYPSIRVEGVETPVFFHSLPNLWQVYTKFQDKAREQGIDWGLSKEELCRLLGVDYQVPAALAVYATMMLRKGDLEAYERYMNQAATGGLSAAFHALGSFYYLTARGRFPRRGDKQIVRPTEGPIDAGPLQEGRLASIYSSVVLGLPSYTYYNALALEWFELGKRSQDDRSALVLAFLYRQAGQLKLAQTYYESLTRSPRQAVDKATADALARHWTDPNYEFGLPECLLQADFDLNRVDWGGSGEKELLIR
ncbi:uncharacterized protein BO80DRAFT_43196 [Aspergillus ibericus CBS 121593]|uniref:Uncharacterized protein n=1 Tax=Aspergillus ibericus CBS 121593 TaxID=1448316 RepID=A0A395H3C4_9EURO|nr:hypothetical protein BO80DRAFT_43196 [Aspergillus ibericus CBS 121593]RAL02246.1 hypothetical protein BO80DRAFT_43196 [Aspergillus ibericus CBS 121593]